MSDTVINLQFRDRPISDAQWIGQLVPRALEEHRYRLASELIKLAARAAAHDRGEHLQPLPVTPTNRPIPEEHLQAVRDAFGASDTRNVPVVRQGAGSRAPQVCHNLAGPVDVHAVLPGEKCGQPIRWSDGGTSSRDGWYHLNGALDSEHQALPGQG